MRKPLPPFVRLSQDGHTAIYHTDNKLHLLHVTDGTVSTLPLPHEAKIMALSPHATLGAIAGYTQLSLFRLTPTVEWLATVNTPAALYRLAVGDNHLVVGTPAFNEAQSTLCIWRWARLIPSFIENGAVLGELAPYHLRLDEENNRILLWGLAGRGAFSGGGDPFVRLFNITEDDLQLQWSGEHMPFKRRGFLFPLLEGQFGIYNREKLVLMPQDINPSQAVQPSAEYNFGDLETVAASPQGSYLAWYWNEDGLYHIRTARLDTGAIIKEAIFDNLGYFPALAVDDMGHTTLAFSEKPNRILIFTVEAGQLVQQVDISIQESN